MSDTMKPVKGMVLFANGTGEERTFTCLNDLQTAVDGFITSVRLYDGKGDEYAQAYVDDEGLLKGLPLNYQASALSFLLGNTPQLVGNMVIVGTADEDGWDTDINPVLLEFLKSIIPNKKEQDDEIV